MIPSKYPITIWRGGTWSIDITQEVIDFSEYDEILLQIWPSFKRVFSSTEPLIELSLTNGRIVIGDVNTSLTLTISAKDTTNLSFNEGAYYLELIKYVDPDATPAITDEVVDKFFYGTVEVEGEPPI